jgi:3-hydroxymyristoyl/3-hydroxydecanoyl-(acyl carrier protein) dehydratase
VNAPLAAVMHGSIEVPVDHPAFAGHFPEFPVLPGAVLLDEVLQIIQRERRLDPAHCRIVSAKFLAAVRPGDVLSLEHDAAGSGLIRFTVRAANRAVASGVLSNAVRTDGSA